MASGELNRLITVQKKVSSTNKYGEQTITWDNYFTPWAMVTNKSGAESFSANQQIATSEVEFKIRRNPSKPINEMVTILFESHRYEVTAVKTIGTRPEYLIISTNKGTLTNINTWLLTNSIWNNNYQWLDSATWND